MNRDRGHISLEGSSRKYFKWQNGRKKIHISNQKVIGYLSTTSVPWNKLLHIFFPIKISHYFTKWAATPRCSLIHFKTIRFLNVKLNFRIHMVPFRIKSVLLNSTLIWKLAKITIPVALMTFSTKIFSLL